MNDRQRTAAEAISAMERRIGPDAQRREGMRAVTAALLDIADAIREQTSKEHRIAEVDSDGVKRCRYCGVPW